MSSSGAWRVTDDAPLRARNTFGVAARAATFVELLDNAALPALLDSGLLGDAWWTLGSGSNVLFAADPAGALLALRGQRIDVPVDDGARCIVRADAGVDWHALVLHTLDLGLRGLENLALIPGTVGAAPIQNIGAYGREVGECIVAVDVYDRHADALLQLDHAACHFAYRDSVFKHAPDRYVVLGVHVALSRTASPRIDYAGLREELAVRSGGAGATVTDSRAPSPRQVADAVIALRRRKLPDPAVIGNAGSFFKNPIVVRAQADALLALHPALPTFPGGTADRTKLSAAWLIDQCGWRGQRDGDAGVSDRHALVLVNHGDASGAQLLALARRIAASVQARFGVALEPEPRIVGAAW